MPREGRSSNEARVFAWLRKLNTEYATVLRWVGLAGMIAAFALNRPELGAAFGGLIPMSLAVGKDS